MERVILMYVWEQSEIVKTHRLTVAMVWALLGVGKVRPSTWAALMRRDLAEHASDGGYRFTATGQDVADELHRLTAESEVDPEGISTDDGPEINPMVDQTAVHPLAVVREDSARGVSEAVTLTRADEVRAGDYVIHAGTRRQVIGTRTEGRDVVLSTVHGTLTMPPGTPLRVSPAQLSLIPPPSEDAPPGPVLAGVA